jgi:hypothetical protein
VEGVTDDDGDGIPNNQDLDSDNDGILDIIEAGGIDTDGDGVADSLTDTDSDGLPDLYDLDNGGSPQPIPDTDGDGKPDFLDRDSDSDGLPDTIEGQDTNSFVTPLGSDMDGDGIDDAFDPDQAGPRPPVPDVDGDGAPDFRDVDSDGDGLGDRDSDGDGIDDAFKSYTKPDSFRAAWRELPATSQCRQTTLQKKIRRIVRTQRVIRDRTENFGARARSCGGGSQTDRIDQSRNLAQELRALLLESCDGAIYKCPDGVCRTVELTSTKRRLKTMAIRLGGLAKSTKLYAMNSCRVKREPPGRKKTRKTSDDYTKDLVVAIGALPNKFNRCP